MKPPQVYISSSRLAKLDTCGGQYEYHYEHRLEPVTASANLEFGKAVDKTVTDWLLADCSNSSLDVKSHFRGHWANLTAGRTVQFASDMPRAVLIQIGEALVQQFVEFWRSEGLTLARDTGGSPLIQRRIFADFGEPGLVPGFPEHQIVLEMVLDLVAIHPQHGGLLLDNKTTRSHYPEVFVQTCDQLTMYDLILSGCDDFLGDLTIDRLGFIELLKRKPVASDAAADSSLVTFSPLVPRRREDVIQRFERKIVHAAEDVLRKRFTYRSHYAFNTPCSMCSYAQLCVAGDKEGLIPRPPRLHA